MEAESGPFSVEAEARKLHIRGKNGRKIEIGSAIPRRRANNESINIKKRERGESFREMLIST